MGGGLKKVTTDNLPVIGLDETVHDQPDAPDPAEEPRSLPEQLHVHRKDDIISTRTPIIFEDCLRQLATFVILPVSKCEALQETSIACGCVPPFDVNIKSKGTAVIVEWVSPHIQYCSFKGSVVHDKCVD